MASDAERELNLIRDEVRKLNIRKQELEKTNRDLGHLIESLKASAKEWEKRVADLSAEHKSGAKAVSDAKTQLRDFEKEVARIREGHQKMISDLQATEKEVAGKTAAMGEEYLKLQTIKTDIKARQAAIEKVMSDLASAKASNEERLRQLAAQSDVAAEDHRKRVAEIDEKNARLEGREASLERLKSDLGHERARVNAKLIELDARTQECVKEKNQHTEAREALARKTAELEEVRARHEQMVRSLASEKSSLETEKKSVELDRLRVTKLIRDNNIEKEIEAIRKQL